MNSPYIIFTKYENGPEIREKNKEI